MHRAAMPIGRRWSSHRASAPSILDPRSSILVFLLAFFASLPARAADLPAKFDPARDAAADVAHAVAHAKASGNRVIVDVGGEWCAWCHIMDRFIAANDDVRALIDAHYVWVKVNFSKENRNEALLGRWPRIRGYPHLFVLDARGALVHSQNTASLESGKGYDRERFIAMLRAWAPSGRSAANGTRYPAREIPAA
jgi:thiol:disulfide interchange protein